METGIVIFLIGVAIYAGSFLALTSCFDGIVELIFKILYILSIILMGVGMFLIGNDILDTLLYWGVI